MVHRKRLLLLALALSFLHLSVFGAVSRPNSRLVSLSKEIPVVFAITDATVKRAEIEGLVNDYFYFEGFARLTIEDHWKKISTGQREQFLQSFQRNFVDSIYDRCSKKNSHDFRFKVKRIKTFKDYTDVVVEVRVGDSSHDVSLIWVSKDRVWKMIDMTVSGANLIVNYKGQFSRLIDDHGFDHLLNKLKEKKALQR